MKPSIFKKMVSIILSCAMCFPMFSTNIFANTNDVVSGYYDNDGNWKQGELVQTLPEGIKSINKSATKIEKNKYKINLKVVTEQNKVTSSKEAATVLVIDTSGSMQDENRMENAKKAAKDFIDTYAGKEVGSGRYVAVVDFATEGKVALGWTDVATENGKKAAENAINSLKANGGTNLHAGLKYASTLLSDSKVNEIDFKNSIVLTDGAPTYYLEKCDKRVCLRNHIKIGDTKYHLKGDGNSGSKTTNEVTATQATTLRSKSKVYTVCYGASKDETYKDGPTVGDFLKNSIASPNCAYNADDASQLNEIFKNITSTIVSGLDGKGLEVVDKLTEFISVSDLPTNITSDGSGFTWKLSDATPTISTDGNKTIYTYELEYIVTIDADNAKFEEGKYYPLNGDTYIMVNGQKVKFPIPAAKGEKTMCTVTYTDGVNEDVVFEDQSKTVKIGEKTPEFTGELERKGYVFVGWSPEVEETVTKDAIYVAQWEKDENGNGIPDKDEEKYQVVYTDGTEKEEVFKNEVYKVLPGLKTPSFKNVGEAGVPLREGYVFAGWSPKVEETVTKRYNVYTALWDRDANNNGTADKDEKMNFTIRYDDGLKEDFFNVEFKDVAYGSATPKFEGNLNVKGYIFKDWSPEVEETVTKDATYVAQWDRDENGNNIPDDQEKRYTVTYTDGVENEVVFEDEVTTGLFVGDLTPEFKQGGEKGIPTRTGYVFMGWSPKPSYIIKDEEKEQIVYTATWEVDKNGDNRPDKDQPYKITYT
ncbi:MAG: vWA domain-containing protein, partial [Peptacetobacter hiranonis]|nr:vWA domain-containing protein [Peptacetobacter hiranonis]